MSWDRAAAAKALAACLTHAVQEVGEAIAIFDKPPPSLNPPALVVGRPLQVQFSAYTISIDEAELPVSAVVGVDEDDRAAELLDIARLAVADRTLGGVVQVCYPALERNWRNLNVAGTDLLAADVVFTIQM